MKKPDGGYIKLDRKILDWRWSATPNTFTVFVHLLMMANYRDCDFEKQTIKRGSLATSYGSLGKQCGLTYDQVRTAVGHLLDTGEITITRRHRYVEISIVNYSQYQDVPTQIPIKSQSNPNQIPIKSQQEKEYIKKGRKERKEEAHVRAQAPPSGVTYATAMKPIDEGTVEDIPEEYRDFCPTYPDYWRFRNR